MSEGVLSYLICYDVTDSKRRQRLAKLLDGYGCRVQYSVYEAVLNRVLFDKLAERIESVMDAETDRVAIYPLCAACAQKRLAFGQAQQAWPGEEIVFVV
jgi:CRISPR-associated protein Cas2